MKCIKKQALQNLFTSVCNSWVPMNTKQVSPRSPPPPHPLNMGTDSTRVAIAPTDMRVSHFNVFFCATAIALKRNSETRNSWGMSIQGVSCSTLSCSYVFWSDQTISLFCWFLLPICSAFQPYCSASHSLAEETCWICLIWEETKSIWSTQVCLMLCSCSLRVLILIRNSYYALMPQALV